jgi:Protein of unknown function (DUF1822)
MHAINASPPYMMSSSIYPEESGASLPEVLWLEPHHFAQARELSHGFSGEALQWQNYANTLAFLGFSQWLDQKMQDPTSRAAHASTESSAANFTEGVCQFKVGEFKLCLIAGEHILNETVHIPQATIFKPELAAHFYIALKVCQEDEQVMLVGILRYDQLTQYLRRADGLPGPGGYYSVPLSLFDPEPNHLLSYVRYLDTSAIPLPLPLSKNVAAPSMLKTKLRKSLRSTNTHLKNWLQDLS